MEPDTDIGEGTQDNAAHGAVVTSSNHTYRENIVDRTGELLKSAIGVAEEHLRHTVGMIRDPRDNTPAHIVMGKNGAAILNPEAFDLYRQFPLARKGTATLTQLASFIELVNRFKEPNSAIFARDDLTAPALTAIFDYHPDNAMFAEVDEVLAHPIQNGHHRAKYAFPLSVEWQAWFGRNATVMSMGEFAQFLETHIVDVSDDAVTAWSEQAQAFAKANRATTTESIATPTRLVDLSLKFRIYETAESCEAVNLTTGETQLTFVSEHKQADGKPVDFPKLFSIVIPIFARSPIFYRIIARLRYRLANGKPVFWFELWRPDLTFETAFNEALDEVKERTGLPIFAGSPEL